MQYCSSQWRYAVMCASCSSRIHRRGKLAPRGRHQSRHPSPKKTLAPVAAASVDGGGGGGPQRVQKPVPLALPVPFPSPITPADRRISSMSPAQIRPSGRRSRTSRGRICPRGGRAGRGGSGVPRVHSPLCGWSSSAVGGAATLPTICVGRSFPSAGASLPALDVDSGGRPCGRQCLQQVLAAAVLQGFGRWPSRPPTCPCVPKQPVRWSGMPPSRCSLLCCSRWALNRREKS